VTAFLEAAYLMCYPMLPLGVMALYALGRADLVAAYWLVVVPAISLCQTATIPFQSWPPWLAFPDEAPTLRRSALREMNEWVTDYASIRANTFPSGHVAGSFAIALFLFTVSPGFGLLFFGIAMSTSVSTVLLGYHYSLDVVLGLVVGAASFLVLR
jgi:membrane-associated phospholipid phosphatase